MPRGVWLVLCAVALAAPMAHAAPHGEVPAAGASTAAPKARRHGAIVVARSLEARVFAKALARLVYQDAALRPEMDEKMAKALLGSDPDEGVASDQRDAAAASRADVLATVRALDAADESVRRRLLLSTAKDLNAELVVLVAAGDGPTARVLKVASGRYAAVTLAAQRVPPAAEGEAPRWDWSDAVPILKSLRQGPPPGPVAPKPVPGPGSSPAPEGEPAQDGEQDGDLLTSPWFWSGLGIVVTVGVTVLVLSQTAFKNSDVVNLQGRVNP